ncbi:VWA domain-containing protein [bacterium]|nr:VWA domain-containing protein [bacterium]
MYLVPGDKYHGLSYFGEKIEAGAPAGDIVTNHNPDTGAQEVGNGYLNGVDCIGFLGIVWRYGAPHFNFDAANKVMRPIRFQDLRAGDALQRYFAGGLDNHVVLFKEWIPGTGEPGEPGVEFWVYEAAIRTRKVVRSRYKLVSIDEANIEKAFFAGGRFPTDKVTIQRMEYCDPQKCVLAPANDIKSDVFPYTYLNPIEVVLVIDRSGSMSGDNLLMAQNSAQMFVDLMRPGDKIGVVSFNSTAYIEFPLQEILSPDAPGYIDIKAQAQTAIEQITAGGGTSIGAGLETGRQQLNENGLDDPIRLMVLLSDGEETNAPYYDDVLPSIIADKIIVHTLALGIGADKDTMLDIADQTGGIYRYNLSNKMTDIFYAIFSKVYSESGVKRIEGTVPSDTTIDEFVEVDSTIAQIRFSLNWPGSDLDLTLVQPDGTLINPIIAESDPNITYTSNSTYEFYTIFAPQPGLWTMKIFGKSTGAEGEDYIATAMARDTMVVSVDVDGENQTVGHPITLFASVDHSQADGGGEHILGASMSVTVVDPSESQYVFELYDDGLHEDGLADDGIYSNSFSNTNLEGSYNFNVRISGINNIYGEAFTREYSLSTVVTAPEFPLTSILDDFNRADGAIGDNWSGNPSGYVIDTNQLKVKQKNDNLDIYWEDTYFGPDQEAYFTFSTVSDTAHDQTLLLKSQDNSGWGYGVLAVQYAAATNSVVVWSFVDPSGTDPIDPIPLESLEATMSVIIGPDSQPPSDQKWTPHGFLTSVTFTSGDQFGARALADGTVEIYKNGVLLATCDISSWPFYDQGGYIGLWFGDAKDVLIDDFGGGDIP